MIFSKIHFVVTCAHSAFLENTCKSSCKVPRRFRKSIALQNCNQINKMCFRSYTGDVDFVIGFPLQPYGHKSCVTSIFDTRPSTPKKALALSNCHLKYILYTLLENHNCRFMSTSGSSSDIVALKIFSTVSGFVC